jgi:pSer/pThr/pTyr-binding forkhead associated (FHA) protein
MGLHSTILPTMAKPARCPRCGRDNDPGLPLCIDCGEPLAAGRAPSTTEALCPSCSTPLQAGFRFCANCGKPARSAPPAPPPGAAAPAPPAAAAAPPATGRFRLTLVRNDGGPGPVFPIDAEETICGRTGGEIRLGDDPAVSPRHARFTLAGGTLRVDDLGSVNGTFLRLKEPRRLGLGEEIRIGRQLLRLEPLLRAARADERGPLPWGTKDPGYRFRLSQLLEGGGLGDIFPLREGENVLGREAGEVVFPTDRYVSARHARIAVAGDEVTLADLGSSNGTYVKIAGADLARGDQLLVGAQLLAVG